MHHHFDGLRERLSVLLGTSSGEMSFRRVMSFGAGDGRASALGVGKEVSSII